MTGFVLDMFFKPDPDPEPKLPPKPELPPVPMRLLDRSMALETKSMNERKDVPRIYRVVGFINCVVSNAT